MSASISFSLLSASKLTTVHSTIRTRVADITDKRDQGPVAWLGLGANLGECKKTLRKAVLALVRHGFRLEACSSLYRTEPWGLPGQPDFLNCVVMGTWNLPPAQMLETILQVEKELGRERREGERWGPRIIDIDLLAAGDTLLDTEILTLPHPRLGERRFVLAPLAEIAPGWRHPLTGQTTLEMLKHCPDQGRTDRLEEKWLVQ